MTGSDVSHVTGSSPDRKWRESRARQYVLRMRNQKLRNIRLHRKWRHSRDRKWSWPEEVMSRSVRVRMRIRFPICFSYYNSSTSAMDTERHPNGLRKRNRRLCILHWKLPTGLGVSPVVVQRGCYLRRSRPIFSMVTQVIYLFPAILFSCHICVV